MGARGVSARLARAMGGRWLPMKWGLIVALVVLGLQWLGAFAAIEPLFTDMHYAWRGGLRPSDDIVVLGITPQCTRKLGPWPWPRRYHAQLIDRLAAAGARVICFDMYFPQASQEPADDGALADAARRAGTVVLAAYKRDALDRDTTLDWPLLRGGRLARNLPGLRAAAAEGHINVRHDRDGIIRRVPLGFACEGESVYQLGVLTAARQLGVGAQGIRPVRGGVAIGDRLVPVDARGNVLVNYYRMPDQSRPLLVSEVLEGKVDPSVFRGKLVFVGQTHHGLQNADVVVTPEGERFGVYVQATLADNVLSGRMLRRAGPVAVCLTVVVLSLACASRLFARRVLGKVAWSVAFAAVAVLVSHVLFERFHVLVDLTPCLAVVVVGNLYGGLVLGILRADREVAQRDREMETLVHAGSLVPDEGVAGVPQRVAANLARALGAEGSCVFLRGEGERLELAAHYGFGGVLSPEEASAASAAANAWVARERRPWVSGRSADAPGPVAANVAIRSALVVPVVAREELYGTIALYNRQPSEASPGQAFCGHDVRLAVLLAQQAAMTLERWTLANHLQEALHSLEATQQKLVESEQLSAVGRMANMVIHDIRSPMQGIRLFAEMSADMGLSPEERREFSATMCSEIDRLVGMCQEILDFARGTTHLAREAASLDDLVAETLASLTGHLEEQGIRVNADLRFEGAIPIDASRMRRVVRNLCVNAIEAMADGGGELRVTTWRRDGGARIEVADTGPGIPHEVADSLFEPFVTHGKDHGTGLGLAIARKVVEEHGGRVGFATEPGQGTTFTIELPVRGGPRG